MSASKYALSPVVAAVETSCDETACAVWARGKIAGERVYSQWRLHRRFGGVVPEIAARDHIRRLLPLFAELLEECGETPDRIAYTAGPGLAGALLAGAATANALAFAWGIPAVPVNHLTGHILSPLLARPDFAFPYLALLASGGHTQIWLARGADDFSLLGATLDDAAGEAFDKTAVLLGLEYPGGAKLEKLAAKGNAQNFSLPSPAQKNLNFSFSGLKSAVRRLAAQEPNRAADIAAAFQAAAAEGLARQAARAMQKTGAARIAAVGGVAQNNAVWRELQRQCAGADLHRPKPAHCGDNAAMIALAAALQIKKTKTKKPGNTQNDYAFEIYPRWQPGETAPKF
ncbi:MAG: tRNA (adenosine(37)-N6)-threonylcarbamoyltransferase complex transferase subunit TsaD [Gammaproteobacteria bacterium]